MLRIFNNKLHREILIDETADVIQFIPKNYEIENPHILIELYNIDFFNHSETCINCKTFVQALGTDNSDWHVEFDNKIMRLNLQGLGNTFKDNQAKSIISNYFTGTKLKLNIDTDTIESLEIELSKNIAQENYEKCVFIRDKIKNITEG